MRHCCRISDDVARCTLYLYVYVYVYIILNLFCILSSPPCSNFLIYFILFSLYDLQRTSTRTPETLPHHSPLGGMKSVNRIHRVRGAPHLSICVMEDMDCRTGQSNHDSENFCTHVKLAESHGLQKSESLCRAADFSSIFDAFSRVFSSCSGFCSVALTTASANKEQIRRVATCRTKSERVGDDLICLIY